MSLSAKFIVVSGVTLLLTGCSQLAPRSDQETTADAARPTVLPPYRGAAYYKDDGPGANPPPNLHAVPDAIPRAEPLHPHANRPYQVKGVTYTPDLSGRPYVARGLASWYGRRYHGRPTSSGEPYDMYGMTAAHATLPIPSYARVTNLDNGRSVVVRINDRGPFHPERIIDLSYTAAYKLDLLRGVGMVEVERLFPAAGDAATSFAAGARDGEQALAPDVPAVAPPGSGTFPAAGAIYLQVGAFGRQEGADALAERLVRNLGSQVPGVLRQQEGGLIKVQTGPYASAEEADRAARDLSLRLGLKPFKVYARGGSSTGDPATAARPAVWLQLGAYANPQAAERLMARLKAQPDLPGVERVEADGLVKVQAGPFLDAGQAEQAALRLAADLGHKPYRLVR